MRRLANENAPCWYELSWDAPQCALLVRIHEKFLAAAGKFCLSEEIAMYIMQRHSFLKLSGDLSGNIGFEDAMLWRGLRGELVEWALPVPCTWSEISRKCSNCQGTGKDDFSSATCGCCHGTGKDHLLLTERLSPIIATLERLFAWLEVFRLDTGSSCPQLMTINTTFDPGQYNGLAIGGDFSPAMKQWLMGLGKNQQLTASIEAMRQVHERMLGLAAGGSNFCHFNGMNQHSLGGFYLECPGNACMIHREGLDDGRRLGDIFTCHNVDSSIQQVTFLVGLAALQDQARLGLSLGQ